jgi:hypothetical protein
MFVEREGGDGKLCVVSSSCGSSSFLSLVKSTSLCLLLYLGWVRVLEGGEAIDSVGWFPMRFF